MYAPELNLSHFEKTWEDLEFIGTQSKKPGHWMQQQFHCTLTVRNCVIIDLYSLRCFLFHIVLTFIRQENANKRYRNILKNR